MDNLFSHPGFRLIFINDNGNISLVNPSKDGSKEDILEKGYRCISHYWGPNPPKWEDHPVKNVTWNVHIREEKQGRLLQIFNHHKGYFWMDVFCTDQDSDNKPLDIMGDVYKNCTECICMVDIPKFTGESCLGKYVTERDYLEDISKTVREAHSKKGISSLVKISSHRIRMFRIFQYKLGNSSWSNRVWTWQESVLPPKTYYCSEVSYTKEYAPMDQEIFSDACTKLGELGYPDLMTVRFNHTREQDLFYAMISPRKCANQEDYIYGILGLLDIYIRPNLDAITAAKELQKELDNRGIDVQVRIENHPWDKLGSVFTGKAKRFTMIAGKVVDKYKDTLVKTYM